MTDIKKMEEQSCYNLYIEDSDGNMVENEVCIDCEYSYVDDIYNELCCKLNKCDKSSDTNQK